MSANDPIDAAVKLAEEQLEYARRPWCGLVAPERIIRLAHLVLELAPRARRAQE